MGWLPHSIFNAEPFVNGQKGTAALGYVTTANDRDEEGVGFSMNSLDWNKVQLCYWHEE
jgi:hypothetical protein